MCAKERVVLIAWRSPSVHVVRFLPPDCPFTNSCLRASPHVLFKFSFLSVGSLRRARAPGSVPVRVGFEVVRGRCGRHLLVLGSLRPVLAHFYLRIFFDLFILFVRT